MTSLASLKLAHRLEAIFRNKIVIRITLAVATLFVAWPAIFSTLALYDDEGYIMMTLQTYMQGHRLYGETHTQYGPAFYFITAPLHSLLNWPLTQTGVRIKTILLWGLAVWFVHAIVRRMSNSNVAAVATALLALLHLDKLTLEPGHPQEITLICSLLALFLFTRSMYVATDVPASLLSMSSWTIVGFVVGILGLVKLNCGVVVAIPLLLTAALQSDFGRRFWWCLLLVAIGPALLIAWLAREHFAASLWALWLAACAGLLIHRSIANVKEHSPRSLCYFGCVSLGGAMAVATVLGLAMLQGISTVELWFGLVGQHSDFADFFFRPIGLSAPAFLGLVFGIGALSTRLVEPFKDVAKFAIWVVTATLIAFTAAMPLEHGMHARGAGLFLAWAAPGWIVWFWRNEVGNSPKKLILGLVAILSPLIAFPVSGTQVQVGTLPGLIVIGILLGEYLVALAQQRASDPIVERCLRYPIVRKWIFTCTILTFVSASVVHWVRYAKGQPLGLIGSAYMRLPESIAAEQKAISKAIVQSGASHLLFEGTNHNRFYFWTGVKPLTPANPTFWPVMLVDGERSALADAIDRNERLCVVRVPNYEWLYFDKATEIRDRIEERWEPSEAIGEWQVGIVH
jgi:hypothetical protein